MGRSNSLGGLTDGCGSGPGGLGSLLPVTGLLCQRGSPHLENKGLHRGPAHKYLW